MRLQELICHGFEKDHKETLIAHTAFRNLEHTDPEDTVHLIEVYLIVVEVEVCTEVQLHLVDLVIPPLILVIWELSVKVKA